MKIEMELNQHSYFIVTNIFTAVLSLLASLKLRNHFKIEFEKDRYELIM